MSIVCDMNDMKVVSSWNPVTVGLAQCHAHQMVILRDSETQSPKSRQRLILQHSSSFVARSFHFSESPNSIHIASRSSKCNTTEWAIFANREVFQEAALLPVLTLASKVCLRVCWRRCSKEGHPCGGRPPRSLKLWCHRSGSRPIPKKSWGRLQH